MIVTLASSPVSCLSEYPDDPRLLERVRKKRQMGTSGEWRFRLFHSLSLIRAFSFSVSDSVDGLAVRALRNVSRTVQDVARDVTSS